MRMSTLLLSSFCVGRSHAFALHMRPKVRRNASSLHSQVAAPGVPRIQVLQTLLSTHGAPGSQGCSEKGDLKPIPFESILQNNEVTATNRIGEFTNLHPHLYPLAKSEKTGNLICALRHPTTDLSQTTAMNSPQNYWPIVESRIGSPGMKLVALSSEDLMLRIVCESDFSGENKDLIDLYNKSRVNNVPPYEPGSVKSLGYGVHKYVLLRVGPFTDIYENLALAHAEKGDEQASLISAEASSKRHSGFASTLLFYSKLLTRFKNREEESRDAARMCLRVPLSSIGMSMEDFRDVAVLGKLADASAPMEEAIAKLSGMYEKIREHEQQDDPQAGGSSKPPEEIALAEANHLLDCVALSGGNWEDSRSRLAELYKSVGYNEMADFVNPGNQS